MGKLIIIFNRNQNYSIHTKGHCKLINMFASQFVEIGKRTGLILILFYLKIF